MTNIGTMIKKAQQDQSKRHIHAQYHLAFICVFAGTLDLRQVPNFHGERLMWELGIRK